MLGGRRERGTGQGCRGYEGRRLQLGTISMQHVVEWSGLPPPACTLCATIASWLVACELSMVGHCVVFLVQVVGRKARCMVFLPWLMPRRRSCSRALSRFGSSRKVCTSRSTEPTSCRYLHDESMQGLTSVGIATDAVCLSMCRTIAVVPSRMPPSQASGSL